MIKTENSIIEKDRKYVTILGVRVDSTQKSEVLARVTQFLSHNHKFSLISVNPELLVMCQKDQKLKKMVNSADISLADGSGLRLAESNLKIIKGRELFLDLIKLAKEKKWTTYFLGGPNIPGVAAGPKLNNEGEELEETNTIEKINKIKPNLLFVGFGMPKQEKWLFKNIAKLNVGGVMTVGGTFDYVYGKAKLPPKWWENLGLEWLWRLLREPKRIKRIINAVIIYPYNLLFRR